MKRCPLLILALACPIILSGQPARKDIRQGNRLFKSEKFPESEASYQKALESDPRNTLAAFNLGDALYRQEKFDEATQQFESIPARISNKHDAAKAFHNLGNANLLAGKIDPGIEAYKEALRRNPHDLDTKYNLAYAMNLRKQQQQQQQQQQQPQNGDPNQQDSQDQQKDPQQGQEKNQDQQQQNQSQTGENQQGQQPQEVKISKEDAKRLLEAIAQDEKKVQEKVKKQKAAAARVRSIKDW